MAYVLTHSDRFTADRFEEDLKAMEVTGQRQACGEFLIYTDFKMTREPPGPLVPKDRLSIRTSHNNPEARLLKDGQKTNRWGSHHPQEKGMWIEIALSSPTMLSGVGLYYNQYAHDMAPSLKVLTRKDNAWIPLLPLV